MIQTVYLAKALNIGGRNETFLQAGPALSIEANYEQRVLRIRHARNPDVRVVPFEHATWTESEVKPRLKAAK